jgi:hypothetical protein
VVAKGTARIRKKITCKLISLYILVFIYYLPCDLSYSKSINMDKIKLIKYKYKFYEFFLIIVILYSRGLFFIIYLVTIYKVLF